jgi:phospholipase/lecithinase/hemolysin
MVQNPVELSIEKQLSDIWMKLYQVESNEGLSLEEMLSYLETVGQMLQHLALQPDLTAEQVQKRQRMEHWLNCYNLAEMRETIDKEKALQPSPLTLETKEAN